MFCLRRLLVDSPYSFQDGPHLLVDFEKAAYASFQVQFRNSEVHGCFFHFKQALHRHVQDLGFQKKYVEDRAFRIRVSSLGALAFLPQEHVAAGFNLLVGAFDPSEKPLLDYFEATWVGKRHGRGFNRKAPVFAIALWSMYDRAKEGDMLTTNAAEIFHRKFADFVVQAAHPIIPVFVHHLKKQQALTNNDSSKISLGQVLNETPECKVRTTRIKELVRRYDENQKTDELVDSIALLYLSAGV